MRHLMGGMNGIDKHYRFVGAMAVHQTLIVCNEGRLPGCIQFCRNQTRLAIFDLQPVQ
jgi:hypothetical protein